MNTEPHVVTYHNTGVMTRRSALLLVLLTIGLVGNVYYGFLHISYWLAFAPALYLYARYSLYRLLLNSFHQALQYDAADQQASDVELRVSATQDAVELNSMLFADRFRGGDGFGGAGQVGHA